MSNTNLLGAYGGLGNAGLQFRNKIINGNFDIWQRGTSQTSAGYGSDDRWWNDTSGSTKTHSQQAFALGQTEVPGNPKYFSRTVVSSVAGASNYIAKYQRVESVTSLAGQTATLSFWAKADAPKNMAVEFYQNFGTGGSPSAGVTAIGVTTIALTTSWKKYTVTADIPSVAGKTLGTNGNDYLQCTFWLEAGSNWDNRTNSLGQQSGTFDIAQVQLEAGPVATPFEHRPIGTELALCQRYYETGNWRMRGLAICQGSRLESPGYYKVTKARIPTFSHTVLVDSQPSKTGGITMYAIDRDRFTTGSINFTVAYTGDWSVEITWRADAEL